MKTFNKRLWRTILATKGQFIAVTVVLAIGLLSFTAFNMTIRNLDVTVNTYYEMTHFADIFTKVVRIPKGQIERLAEIEGINQVQGNIVQEVKLDTKTDEKAVIRLISYRADVAKLNDVYLIDGQKPVHNDDIMLVQMFAEARGLAVGDTLQLIVSGRTKTMNICAIVANPEYIYLIEDEQTLLPDAEKFGVGYVKESFASTYLGYGNAYNEVHFTAKAGVDIEVLMHRIEKKLDRYGVIRIFKRSDHISARMVKEEIEQGKKSAMAIPVIFLTVAAFIIAVMINRIVKADRTAIGVFKAMGYNNRIIFWHYSQYALAIGVLGSLLGALSGTLLAGAMAKLYTETVFNIPILIGKIYSEFLVIAVLMGSLFCVLAGFYGAKSVLAIHPAEAMRPEPPKVGKAILLERFAKPWSHLSFTWKVVLRNLFRNKKRTVFVVLGIALTYAITLVPLYMLDSFYSMFDKQYGKFYKMDYTVSLTNFYNDNIINEIKGVIKADIIEPQVEFPFELISGWRKKSVSVIGVQEKSQLYEFKEREKSIVLPHRGIALSEGLAKYLSVEKGDTITVSSFLPGRKDINVRVSAIIEQMLGVNAYMSIHYMQEHLLDSQSINGVIIKGDKVDHAVFDTLKNVKSVQSLADLKSIFKQFTTLTYSSIGVMVVSAGFLGFAIVYNATIMTINERKLEFSSLRILGFDKNEIFKLILRETAMSSILGIVLGIPLGARMIEGIATTFSNELYTLKVVQNPTIYFYTAISTAFFIFISQIATHSKIHKLDFIEALKARIS